MLISRNDAALLVIDVQEKLIPAMSAPELTVKRIAWLLGVASELDLPIVISEQYPKGLGHTVPELLALAPQAEVVEKVHFSCVAAQCLPQTLLERKQIILCGIETHVCVLQTALDFVAMGKQVFVVTDAIDCRGKASQEAGIARMRDNGVQLVTREMVAFEAMGAANFEKFRLISKTYLVGNELD